MSDRVLLQMADRSGDGGSRWLRLRAHLQQVKSLRWLSQVHKTLTTAKDLIQQSTDESENPVLYLQTILGRFNIQQVNFVYLACMYNNVQLCWILKSHLTNPKRPKHYLQQVLITNIPVFFDACYA
jgi:hypothetical protein